MTKILKDILPTLILENQGGFIKGRKIWDNIILVQEEIHSSARNQEKGMVVKIYLASSFDRVWHAFLFKVMRRFGFDRAFIRWVKACIRELWISPLINGRVNSFLKSSRGLH